MKKRKIIIPLILFLSFYFGNAQLIMIDDETGEFRYEEVVRAEGLSSAEIKSRAMAWLGNYYTEIDSMQIDSNSIKQLNIFHFNWKLIRKDIKVNLFFDLKIIAKDNRYKYDFNNFKVGKLVNGTVDGMDLKTYIDRFPTDYQILIEEPIDNEMTTAIESLIYFVSNNKMEPTEDNW
ncbi:DUF4468 domain-containing protein [Lutimonas zeaxanthinifaciens]|uniref:DUF4468 domain-containing protein n=1 Tax=Lutimonas zeaxanthinifaciens TaxID=3060215 RepID=UPI00265D26FA|nr:DUF4468 domain-containing protein [Lutimonas sp. YSD2104]WKK66869.1 DUF4468 domain-containing protein [Lutimonas sp. YSD2104]